MNLWFILGFPVWLGLSYTAVYTALYFKGGKTAIEGFSTNAYFLYPIFLLIFMIVVFFTYNGQTEFWFTNYRGLDPFDTLIMITVGVLVGALLYLSEYAFNKFTSRNQIVIQLPSLLAVLLLLSAMIAIIEEVIWRGYLIALLHEEFSLSLLLSALLSALFFGLHHYFFGWRTIISKVFSAIIWTLLVVRFQSLIPAIIAHFTADAILWVYSHHKTRQLD